MLSVIIPTRNRAMLLRGALQSLLLQTLSPDDFEVIVVDNASVDDTRQVVDMARTSIRNLTYLYAASPGLHVGRHAGLQHAQGEVLVYVDDDVEANPSWLEAVSDSFRDAQTMLVGGKCLPKFEVNPADWLEEMWKPNRNGYRILGFLSLVDLGSESRSNNEYVFGCNFAIRRSMLLKAGGFHPDAMPQELIRFRGDGESHVRNYVMNEGYRAIYNPIAAVYHFVPKDRMTFEYFCRRAFNQGISDSYTEIRANGVRKSGSDSNGASSAERMAAIYRRIRYKSATDIFRAAVKYSARKGSRLLKELPHLTFKPESRVLALLRERISRAYKAGYAYHRQEVANDPQLLAWVLRPHYWDSAGGETRGFPPARE